MDIKGEIDRNTVIVRDFNTSLISMDRSSRQKINKQTTALNDKLEQMDLIDIFKAFHSKAAEYTYFSNAHGTFSRIYHILVHKTNLNKFKKIENISSIFSEHNAMKLETNHRKNTEKHVKTWKLSNMLLNDEYINNEIKEEIKRYLETRENEDKTIQTPVGHWENNLREIHSITGLHQKTSSSNKQSNFTLKGT